MPPLPEDLKEMEKKIASLKNKHNPISHKEEGYSQLGMAFQILTELVSGILVGAGIGYILDELFDFRYVLLLIFIIIGAIAGMVNVFRFVNRNEEKGE